MPNKNINNKNILTVKRRKHFKGNKTSKGLASKQKSNFTWKVFVLPELLNRSREWFS